MPRHCSVPNCTSNYESTLSVSGPISTFSFPKDPELSRLWLKSISREDFKVTPYIGVCCKHFKESEIVRYNEVGQALKYVRLVKGAVPSVFPVCPKLTPSRSRKEPDRIKTFQNFRDNFESKLDLNDWFFKISEDSIVFFLIESNDTEICQFKIRISVSKELIVRVFVRNVEQTASDLNNHLPKSKKVTLWPQFSNILKKFKDYKDTSQSNRKNHLTIALLNLEAAHAIDDGYEQVGKLDLLINQLKHLFTKKM